MSGRLVGGEVRCGAMKVVVVPDSFKGTLTAQQICDIVAASVRKYCEDAEVVKIPAADGGEGFTDCYLNLRKGIRHAVEVTDPIGDQTLAAYGILQDGHTAVMEMAKAAGITLVPFDKRNPMVANTRGVGELVASAVRNGCDHIIMGLGGSATVDGGMGMADALGLHIEDENGNVLASRPEAAKELARVSGVPAYVDKVRFTLAVDVDSPLCGQNGAAHVFGPQKGANDAQVEELDALLDRYATLLEEATGRSLKNVPGSGAAGGMALPLLAYYDTTIVSGIDLLLDVTDFEKKAKDADLIVTGEGKMDGQTQAGKVPVGVARRAAKLGKPVIAVCGCVGPGYEKVLEEGIGAVFTVPTPSRKYAEVRADAGRNLGMLTDSIFYLWANR